MANKFFADKCCATCSRWLGKRDVSLAGYVIFDSSEKGRCIGGDWHGVEVIGNNVCKNWRGAFIKDSN